MMALMACGISACGNKGKLKSPSQIVESEAKKRAHMEHQDNEDDTDDLNLPQTIDKTGTDEAVAPTPNVPATPGFEVK
jgi:predicted small lipoprotein YifL